MTKLLDVAAGHTITLTANGRSVSGRILRSQQYSAVAERVVVECEESVDEGETLRLPSVPRARTCGTARPEKVNGRTVVVLSVGYAHIDLATVEN